MKQRILLFIVISGLFLSCFAYADKETAYKLFMQGEELYYKEYYEEAVKIYKRTFDKFRDNVWGASAGVRIGDSFRGMKDYKSAIEAYRKVYMTYSKSRWSVYAHLLIAECYSAQSKYDDARKYYKDVSYKYSRSYWALLADLLIAESYRNQGDINKAIESYRNIISKYPRATEIPGITIQLGNLHALNKEYSQAAMTYRSVIDKYPFSDWKPLANILLCGCYFKLGEKSSALSAFEKLVRDDLGNIVEMGIIYDFGIDSYIGGGKNDLKIDTNSKSDTGAKTSADNETRRQALGIVEKYIESNPQNMYAPRALLQLADVYIRDKNRTKALNIYEKVNKYYPSYAADALLATAECYKTFTDSQNQYVFKAIDYYKRVVDEHPERAAYAQVRAGDAYLSAGNSEKALECYNKIVKEFPECKENVIYYGYIQGWSPDYTKSPHYNTSVIFFDRIMNAITWDVTVYEDINRGFRARWASDALFKIAGVYKGKNDYLTTMDKYKKIAEEYPEDITVLVDAYLGIADCYVMKKEYSSAIRTYEELIKMFPPKETAASCQYRIGECYEKMKDTGSARMAYKKTVDLYPGTESAKKAEQRIKAIEQGEKK